MGKRDYYKVLDVSPSASDEEIKRAYRRLAKKYHPDRNRQDASAEARFKEVQEAYDVLSDKQKRGAYDRFGHAGVGMADEGVGGFRGASPGAGPFSGGAHVSVEDLHDLFDEGTIGGGVGDLFEQFLRRGPRAPRTRRAAEPLRGDDIEHRVTISFEQSIRGASLAVELRDLYGRGNGPRQTLTVKIPPGVRDGQKIRLRGKGQPGTAGGPPGDLLIECHVRPHRYFRREGDDILIEVPISIAEATLGARVDVPTVEGRASVTIPPGTASGTKLRLKDRGVWNETRKTRGHQYVLIKIVPPQSVSPQQEESLRQLLKNPPRRGFEE